MNDAEVHYGLRNGVTLEADNGSESQGLQLQTAKSEWVMSYGFSVSDRPTFLLTITVIAN